MADGYVGVAPDGTGKKVDSSELTVGTNVVERQRIVHADDTNPLGLAKVTNAAPGSTDYGSVVRVAGTVIVDDQVPVAPQFPGYIGVSAPSVTDYTVDTVGSLMTRGPVLTDEGSFRMNFSGTTAYDTIGTVSIAGAVVTGTGFLTTSVKPGEYFKISTDADTAYVQILSVTSTTITLASSYVGAASGTGARSIMKPSASGTGAAVTFATGATYTSAFLSAGTAANGYAQLTRKVDFGPLSFRTNTSITTAASNNVITWGYQDGESITPKWFARFRQMNSIGQCFAEVGRNPTGSPSAAETETYTIIYPPNVSYNVDADYQIQLLQDSVVFLINGIIVATCSKIVPGPADIMYAVAQTYNSLATTAGSVKFAFVASKNFNAIDTVQNNSQPVTASTAETVLQPFNITGTTSVNQVVTAFDCAKYRHVQLSLTAIQSAGTLTVQWSNDPVFGTTVTGTSELIGANNISTPTTPITAIGTYFIPIMARYCRIIVSAISATGTHTGNIVLYSTPPTNINQRISGAVTISGTATASGAAAAGTAIASAGNPIMVGGSDGTSSRTLSTSTSGVLNAQVTGATGTAMLPAAAASADALANPTITQVGADNMLFNGTTWDRERNNVNGTTGDSGVKTALFNGATQTNYDARGAFITCLVSAVSGTTPQLTIQLQYSPDGGTTWLTLTPSTAVLSTAGTANIYIYPTNLSSSAGSTPANPVTGSIANIYVNSPLPRTWRVYYAISGTTPSFTITGTYVNYIK